MKTNVITAWSFKYILQKTLLLNRKLIDVIYIW